MGTNADVSFLSGGRRQWPEILQSETVAWEVSLPGLLCLLFLAACTHPGCLSKAVGLVTVAALGVYL